MTPIQTKDLGIDEATQLSKQLQVWSVFSNAKTETIEVYYDIVLLAPNGATAALLAEKQCYVRYNRPAVLYIEGEVMEAGTLATGGEIIPGSDPEEYYPEGTPVAEGTIALGGEIKKAANMKFNDLRNSPIGQGIAGLIAIDVASYPNVEQY